jgi:RNA polymerase sigma factor (sigma-70 family)
VAAVREPVDDSAGRVEAMVARHGPALLRVANQFSLCHDDALDAYQRALEIYLRRLDSVERATEGAWMRVVVKHEAMAIRRARAASVERDDVDLDESISSSGRDVEDQVAGGERVDRSVEALRALKPDEAKALMLKAQGLSYKEIGRRFGWTYTKTNRAITEGRKRFMDEFRELEAGERCERHADVVAALAEGRATSAQVISIRPHLRHCAACRAAVRDLRLTRRRRIALWLPWTLLSRVVEYATTMPAGGGRLGAAAALLGLCAAGGAAGVCAVSGGLPKPPLVAHATPAPAKAAARAGHHRRHAKPKPTATPARTVASTATPPAKPTATPRPTTHHHAVAAKQKRPPHKDEFSFEGSASSAPATTSRPLATAASAGSSATPRSTAGAAPVKPSKPTKEFGFEGG